MTARPLVTAIIPCFNQGKYLRACIDSLFAQRQTRWQAIVIDDASTDGETPAICDAVESDRVRVIHLADNHGRCRARNVAIVQARTEAIFPLDADDLLHPDHFLETVPSLLAREDVGFVYSDYEKFGAEEGILHGQPFRRRTMYRQRYVWAGSLFRKSAWERVGGYDDAFRDGSEDHDLFLSFVDAGYRGVYVPRPLLRYRCHEESWSRSDIGGCDRELRARLRLAKRHHDGFVRHRALGGFLADTYADEAKRLARAGDRAGAGRRALEAIRHAPLSPRLWRKLSRLASRD